MRQKYLCTVLEWAAASGARAPLARGERATVLPAARMEPPSASQTMHSAPVAAAAAPRAPWELISTGGGAGGGTDGEAELRDPSGVFVVRRNGPFASAELAILPEHGPLKSEGNAMVSMSPAVLLETQLEGGALNACCLCCCASEWPFFNKYSLKEGGGRAVTSSWHPRRLGTWCF